MCGNIYIYVCLCVYVIYNKKNVRASQYRIHNQFNADIHAAALLFDHQSYLAARGGGMIIVVVAAVA